MESNHNLATSTLFDPHLKKIAFRDRTAAQQDMQQLVQEMSSLLGQAQNYDEVDMVTEPTTLKTIVPVESFDSTFSCGCNSPGKARIEEENIFTRRDNPLSW